MTRPGRATLLYAAAFLGAHLSFIPLFVFLLPRRVAALAGDHALPTLSLILVAGGIAASLANIAAGRLSDRWLHRRGNRRGLIAIGLALTVAALAALPLAPDALSLGVGIVLFQGALNLMFAPLTALLADHVDDAQKGRVAGWLNAALPLAGLGTAQAALAFPDDAAAGFASVVLVALLLVAPLLVAWPFGPARPPLRATGEQAVPLADYARLWASRLLVQLGAAFVINYFYLYLDATRPGDSSALLGRLSLLSAVLAALSTLGAGQLSDRWGRRRAPLALAAATMAGGLVLLAGGQSVTIGYVAVQVGLAAFLAVDSATIAQLVGASRRRGQWLGVMNLTNTVPAVLVPLLALASTSGAHDADWPLDFSLAAAAALLAAGLAGSVRSVR